MISSPRSLGWGELGEKVTRMEKFLAGVFVIAFLAAGAVGMKPVLTAHIDNAAANRAAAEAARIQADAARLRADAARIDAQGDFLNNVTLSAIAIGAVCMNSLVLIAVVAMLFVLITGRDSYTLTGTKKRELIAEYERWLKS